VIFDHTSSFALRGSKGDEIPFIDWDYLSANPSAIHLLEANPDMIDWDYLSMNPTEWAIHLLEADLDRVDWCWLSGNPAAVHLLEADPNGAEWNWLSRNPAIFKINRKSVAKYACWLGQDPVCSQRESRSCFATNYAQKILDKIPIRE